MRSRSSSLVCSLLVMVMTWIGKSRLNEPKLRRKTLRRLTALGGGGEVLFGVVGRHGGALQVVRKRLARVDCREVSWEERGQATYGRRETSCSRA